MIIKNLLTGLFFLIVSFAVSAAEKVGIYFVVDSKLISAEQTTIDLKERMEMLILETNEYYSDSGISIQLNLENIEFRNISRNGEETDNKSLLSNIGNQTNGFENIFSKADRFGGDYIVAIVEGLTEKFSETVVYPTCGTASQVGQNVSDISSTNNAYLVMGLKCGSNTMAHELGHLMGLGHGEKVAACTNNDLHKDITITNYAKGWAVGNCVDSYNTNKFGTIMVGTWLDSHIYGDGELLPLFSNPNLHNRRCTATSNGITTDTCGDFENGDAVRALNELRHFYASHETRDADALPYSDRNLKKCLMDKYSNTEVADLSNLNCAQKGINGIEGIDLLTELEKIDLSNNNIINVSPLEKVSPHKLVSINLDGNNAALCHQLKALNEKFPNKITLPDECLNIGSLVAVLGLLL